MTKPNPRIKTVRNYLETRFHLQNRAYREALEDIATRTEQGKEHLQCIAMHYPRADRNEALADELCKAAAEILAGLIRPQKSDRP
jgi:hypothetical protein